MDEVELPDHIFSSPCTITLAGPSGSGKTCLAMEILKYRQQLFSQPVAGVVYFYSEMQDLFKKSPPLETRFHYGMPSEEELLEYIDSFGGHHFLMIYDDLMVEVAKSSMLQDVSTKMAHHRNFSCLVITQNLYQQGTNARSQSLNSQYYLLTRTCRDLRQIGVLGAQLHPGKGSKFIEVYQDAVDNPFKPDYTPHLMVSCHPHKSVRGCQLLSGIVPPGGSMVMYRV